MEWNPANWSIVDQLQGQEAGPLNPSSLTAGFAAGGGYAQPTSQPSGTNVLGVTTQNVDPNQTLFFNTQTGAVDQSNIWDTGSQQAGPTAADIAAQQARQNSINRFQTAGSQARQSGVEQMDSSLGQQRGSILDYFTGAGRTLQGLNQRRTNAEMSLRQGGRDIMGMVGRGIQSGNVMLANKNASSSSAKGQLAKAYGQMGNREQGKLQNQYGLENQDINMQQGQFDEDVNTFAGRKLDEWKNTQADTIANQVRNALATLDAQAQGADLGSLFQIEQEKQAIKAQALSKFGELDNLVATERAKLTPLDTQGARGQAVQNEQLGQSAPQMFDFNTQAETARPQGQQTGPALYSNTFIPQKRRGV